MRVCSAHANAVTGSTVPLGLMVSGETWVKLYAAEVKETVPPCGESHCATWGIK